MWPFRRRTPDAVATSEPPPAGWREVAPIERTVPAVQRSVETSGFTKDLAAWRRPDPLVAPLEHVVSPEAPAGLVQGVARPVVQRTAAKPPAQPEPMTFAPRRTPVWTSPQPVEPAPPPVTLQRLPSALPEPSPAPVVIEEPVAPALPVMHDEPAPPVAPRPVVETGQPVTRKVGLGEPIGRPVVQRAPIEAPTQPPKPSPGLGAPIRRTPADHAEAPAAPALRPGAPSLPDAPAADPPAPPQQSEPTVPITSADPLVPTVQRAAEDGATPAVPADTQMPPDIAASPVGRRTFESPVIQRTAIDQPAAPPPTLDVVRIEPIARAPEPVSTPTLGAAPLVSRFPAAPHAPAQSADSPTISVSAPVDAAAAFVARTVAPTAPSHAGTPVVQRLAAAARPARASQPSVQTARPRPAPQRTATPQATPVAQAAQQGAVSWSLEAGFVDGPVDEPAPVVQRIAEGAPPSAARPVVQRAEEPTVNPTPPEPTPAAPAQPAPNTTSPSAAPPAKIAPTAADLDDLARRLYSRLRDRMRSELRIERERSATLLSRR